MEKSSKFITILISITLGFNSGVMIFANDNYITNETTTLEEIQKK